jgi:AcrR family transcriptional regulator
MSDRSGAGPTRRQRGAAQTRRRLVEAARRLFREHGFETVTTEQIAVAAGVAKGTVFLHARTKERLLVMVYEEEMGAAQRAAVARPPRGGTIVSALVAVFRRFFAVHEKDPALARHLVKEVLSIRPGDAPVWRGVQEDALRGLAALIAERQRRGEVAADVDPALAAANSFLLYYGVLTGWLSGWIPDDARDRSLVACLALHWRGLEGPAPVRRTKP